MKLLLKSVFVLVIIFALSSCNKKEENEELWSVKMAKSEMVRFPELWMIENAKKPRWTYTFGLVAKSMLELTKHTGDSAYFYYTKNYADSLINEFGQIKTYDRESYNIDHISPGKMLFDLYETTREDKYKAALDTLRNQLKTHPRTAEGGFWHKLKYPHQMWLDGLFMASPFLVEYGEKFNEPALFDEAVHQLKLVAKHTYDEETGLFYHGWDESREQYWADKNTGTSPGFWSRSLGWYGAALVDALDFIPEETEGRDSLITLVNTVVRAIKKYQDPESGVWYQVTDLGDREGNYLESSASSLFVYILSKALNNGYIDSEYKENAVKGFEGIIDNFIKKEENGTYTITNCCAVAGLGGDKGRRDGSFEYYISEPVIENDPKSVGAFIFAAIEFEKQNKTK
ncbi:MAG: glycoside hydrolase family 88 protein [Porphyromonadaceae bacterium]|nr:glycoside hydrolase family 88 protein [Porphyromonadaceae bacterium]